MSNEELGLRADRWRKSTRSDGQNTCVEVQAPASGGRMAVRDSKDPDGAILLFPSVSWQSFADAAAGKKPFA